MFRLLRKWDEPRVMLNGQPVRGAQCEYEAVLGGQRKKVRDRVSYRPDGAPRGMLNTSKNVSYYRELARAMGI